MGLYLVLCSSCRSCSPSTPPSSFRWWRSFTLPSTWRCNHTLPSTKVALFLSAWTTNSIFSFMNLFHFMNRRAVVLVDWRFPLVNLFLFACPTICCTKQAVQNTIHINQGKITAKISVIKFYLILVSWSHFRSSWVQSNGSKQRNHNGSDMSHASQVRHQPSLGLSRQGFPRCPACASAVLDVVLSRVSHGLSLGWFGLPVIGLCFKQALCVSCVPSCYLHASYCMLHIACFMLRAWCHVLCFAFPCRLGLHVSIVLSSAPLHLVYFWHSWFHEAPLRGFLSLSHTHQQFHARTHTLDKQFFLNSYFLLFVFCVLLSHGPLNRHFLGSFFFN